MNAEEWYDIACDLEAPSPEEAQRAYRRALALDPDHVDAHINLGRLLHADGELGAAEEHYRAALERDPRDATAAFNLGVLLEDIGEAEQALETYRQAVLADPELRRRPLQRGHAVRATRPVRRRPAPPEALPRTDRRRTARCA